MRTLSSTVRFGNRRMFWKVRPMPMLRDLERLQPDDVLAVEEDFAAGRHVQPGDHVEDGRLARAVRTDQPVELALLHGQVEVAHRAQAAEDLGQVL